VPANVDIRAELEAVAHERGIGLELLEL
jgi:hypothetical protein